MVENGNIINNNICNTPELYVIIDFILRKYLKRLRKKAKTIKNRKKLWK